MLNMQAPAVGMELDGFRLTEVLGRGGMGVVYKAEDLALSRSVAIKMIDPNLVHDEGFLRRFRAEARALARIDSPYIVRIHALRQSEDWFFIVMEYVDGGTVFDLPCPCPWARALPLMKEMLTGLEHAHSVGIVHRDIKPRNIMLAKNGSVKITDFGLAKESRGDGATVTQGIAGTLYYMSPEQIKGLATLDHRSDIYSMGMTFYEMLAGRLPFDKDASEFSTMRTIVEDPFVPPTEFRKDLPPRLAAIIMKALEKDPDRRYGSAHEMCADLENVEQSGKSANGAASDDATRVMGALPEAEKKRVRWPVVAAIGGVLILVAALGAFLLPSTGGPPEGEAAPSVLSIRTQPPGAVVWINGRSAGTTPVAGFSLVGDSASVALMLGGYASVDTMLSLQPGAEATMALTLRSVADEQVDPGEVGPGPAAERPSPGPSRPVPGETSAPAHMVNLTVRAEGPVPLRVNGSAVASGASTQVPMGRAASVTCGSAGMEARTTLTPRADESVTCYAQARISVVVTGGSTWGSLFVNGQPTGDSAPVVLERPAGTYRLLVTRVGYQTPAEQTVTLAPSFDKRPEARVSFELQPSG